MALVWPRRRPERSSKIEGRGISIGMRGEPERRRSLRWLGLGALGLAMILSSCVTNIGGTVGSGTAKTETRNASGFTSVTFSGIGTLNIKQTGVESLTVSADDNVLPLLTSTVSNGTLTLGVETGHSINPAKPIVYFGSPSQVTKTISGAGVVKQGP